MNLTELRTQHQGFLDSGNASPGQFQDSTTIIELLDRQEKLDFLLYWAKSMTKDVDKLIQPERWLLNLKHILDRLDL